jgi:hypothetical protein
MFKDFIIDFGVNRPEKKKETSTEVERPRWEDVVIPQLEIVEEA